MKVEAIGRATGFIVGGDFSDPTNERLIYLSALGLGLVGLILLIGTIVWWRRGRQEHPALAPLEVMGARSWLKAPEGDRRRRLDQVRVAGAGGAAIERIVAEPVDLRALVRNMPDAFDDLREPSDVDQSEAADPDDVVAEWSAAPEPAETDDDVDPIPGGGADATSISSERPDTDDSEPLEDEPATSVADDDPGPTADEAPSEVGDDIESVEAMASGPKDPPL